MTESTADLVARVGAALDADGHAAALRVVLAHFGADGGTIHRLGEDGLLHLAANVPDMPPALLDKIRSIPVGKGMAGLAVERREPVQSCNLQTDTTGDVRPGARQTGLQGSTCVPILDGERAVGALGIGTRATREFTAEENALLVEVGRALAR